MTPQIDFDAEKHIYSVDGKVMPGVTEILGYIKGDTFRTINPSILAYAAERGKCVHEALEMIDYGEDPEVPPEAMPYVDAYTDFIFDHAVEWYGIEQMVYNPGRGYCGTVDRYGMVDGEMAVVDIKTIAQPSCEDYMSLAAQTAAYDEALVITNARMGWVFKKHYGLFLRKDGTYRLADMADYEQKMKATGMMIFCQCLNTYKFLEETKSNGKRKRNSSK